MSEKILNHFNSYEWNGLFWFPEDSEKKFSGKVTYSPERGIRIQLILLDNTPYSFSDGIKRKIMHGAVQGEDLTFITLVNLSLYPSKMLLSQQSLASMEGNVSYLISGIHCKDDNFKKLRFQYDEQFESIFFYPIKKDTQLVKYSKGPKVQLNNCTVISMDMETQGHFLLSGEEIDTLFWSNDKDKIEKLKACVDNIMTDESFDLNKITSLRCVFDFENSEPSLLKIFELEEKWRSFWEFLLDQELLPISIWVDVRFQNPHDGKSYSDFKPVLKKLLQAYKTRKF